MKKTPTQLQTFTPPSDSATTNVVVTAAGNQQSLRGDYRSLIENPQRDFDEKVQSLAVKNEEENAGNYYRGLGNIARILTEKIFGTDSKVKIAQLKPEEYYKQGLASASEGLATNNPQKRQEALDSFNKAVELGLNTAEVFYEKGLAHKQLKQYQEALKAYDKARELDPNDSRIFYEIGFAHLRLDQYQEALDNQNKAIEMGLNTAEVFYEKGMAQSGLGQDQEVIYSLDQAIKLGLAISNLFHEKGLAHTHLEQYQPALDAFNRALELNSPMSRMLHKQKMRAHYNLGQYPSAAADFAKCLFVNPFDPNSYTFEQTLTSLSFIIVMAAITHEILQERHHLQNQQIQAEAMFDDRDTRRNIRTHIMPALEFYIDDSHIEEEHKKRLQAIPSNIAGEIFDKISGRDDQQSVRKFIREKLNSVEDVISEKDKFELLKTFMSINEFSEQVRLEQRTNAGLPHHVLYSSYNAGNPGGRIFSQSVFEKVLAIFDEEMPKYLKEKHQELLDQKQTASSSVAQPVAVAVAPVVDRSIDDFGI